MTARGTTPFLLALVAGWLVSNVGAVAAPMAESYGVSLTFVGVLAAAAVATHALMQIPSGRLVDRYGARAAAIAGLSILVAADGLGALAPGSDLLRARRAPAFTQGLYGGTAMSGAGLALALLPQVSRGESWRVSWLSAALLAGGALVVLLLSRPGRRPEPAPQPAAAADTPSVLRDRRLYRLGIVYTASYGTSLLVGNWVVTLLERGPHYSAAEAGAAGALTLFAGIVSRPLGGWLGDRRPELTRTMIRIGVLTGAAGTVVLTLEPPLALGVAASAAVGIGAGLPFGPVFSGAQRVRPDRPAAAVGFVNFVANTFVVVGVPLVGLTFSLPGQGRIGLLVVAGLWAAALAVIPSTEAFSPASD